MGDYDTLFDPEGKAERSDRPRDLSWEALVEVTEAVVATARGELNHALKVIRELEPDLSDEDLALLIRLRAEDYREMWPDMSLTPSALSTHWLRIRGEVERRYKTKVPVEQNPTEVLGVCGTCGGDRVVTVSYRQSGNPLSPHEECAPCPDCNPRTVSWVQEPYRNLRKTPGPDEVKEMIGQ